MTWTEQMGFAVFATTAVAILVAAACELVRMALERRGRRVPPGAPAARWYRRSALALAATGVLCIAYGAFVEPYWPEVTHVRLTTPKLRPGSPPVRVAQISDLHSDPRARLEDRVPGLVAAERPDLIVFTGDAINSPGGLENFRRCMTKLAAVAPTYAVRGNWDAWFWSGTDLFAGTGVRELDGDGAEVVAGDARLWVCGVAVGHEARSEAALGGAPAGDYTIYLYHYPDDIYSIARGGRADLYCAGHTHGGQIALPFYGAIVTLSRFGKRFESGLYRVDTTWLYVNRGIGMEGGDLPRVRFWARPEVTIFEIAADG